jgi:hypothetical protein
VVKSFVSALTIHKLLSTQLYVDNALQSIPLSGRQFSRLRLLKTDMEGMDMGVVNAAMDFYVEATGSLVVTAQFPCVLEY